MSDVQKFIEAALRGEIKTLLAGFPDNQTALFARVFPNGIEKIGEAALRQALALCYRTTTQNEGGDFNRPRLADGGESGR